MDFKKINYRLNFLIQSLRILMATTFALSTLTFSSRQAKAITKDSNSHLSSQFEDILSTTFNGEKDKLLVRDLFKEFSAIFEKLALSESTQSAESEIKTEIDELIKKIGSQGTKDFNNWNSILSQLDISSLRNKISSEFQFKNSSSQEQTQIILEVLQLFKNLSQENPKLQKFFMVGDLVTGILKKSPQDVFKAFGIDLNESRFIQTSSGNDVERLNQISTQDLSLKVNTTMGQIVIEEVLETVSATEREKSKIRELVVSFNDMLGKVIKSKETAGEKRARVQTFIDSIESAAQNNLLQWSEQLLALDIATLKREIGSNENLEKNGYKQYASSIANVFEYLKVMAENKPEFEKRIHLVGGVLMELLDLWGGNFYNAFSIDPKEKQIGVKGISEDFFYFKREFKSIWTIFEIAKNSKGFKNLTPTQTRDLAQSVQKLGLLYIKFAQSLSNIIIPGLKMKASSVDTNQSNVLALQETISKLEEFQDGLPPISEAEAQAVLDKEIANSKGKNKDFLLKIKEHIDLSKPFKSGTIGTTYKVKIPVNKLFNMVETQHYDEYIIKIARPDLREELLHGQKLFKTVITLTSALFPSFLQWIPRTLSSSFDSLIGSFNDETNFLKEAQNIKTFKMLLMFSSTKVPTAKFASDRLLIMESVKNGEKLDDFVTKRNTPSYKEYLRRLTELRSSTYSLTQEQRNLKLEELDLEFPVEKKSLDQITQVYGDLLGVSVQMIVALQKVHADAHTGNILVSSDYSNVELSLIDWGQVVDIKGLLFDPLFLLAYTALGNSKEIAHRIYNLRDVKSSVSEKEILKIVQEVMRDNNLDVKGKTILGKTREFLKQIKNEATNGPSASSKDDLSGAEAQDQFKFLAEVVSKVMTRLFQETDYVVSGRYLQFFRTIVPLGSSLLKLADALPSKTAAVEAFKKVSGGLFMGNLRALFLKYPAQLIELKANIDAMMKSKGDYLEGALMKTPKVDESSAGSASHLSCKGLFAH